LGSRISSNIGSIGSADFLVRDVRVDWKVHPPSTNIGSADFLVRDVRVDWKVHPPSTKELRK
jgi:hypothetical protein